MYIELEARLLLAETKGKYLLRVLERYTLVWQVARTFIAIRCSV